MKLALLLLVGCGRSEVFFRDGLPPGYANAGLSGGSPTGSSSGLGTAGANGGGNGSGSGGVGGGLTGGRGNGGSTGQSCQEAGLGNPSGSGCDGCPKPKVCGDDPFAGEGCQFPCQQNSDCPQLYTVCNGSFCQTNLCGPGTGNGLYGKHCNATGSNDGICVPQAVSPEVGMSYTVGLCYQGGTSTRCCDSADATRCSLGEACVAGMICVDKICGTPCSMNQNEPCPDGESDNLGGDPNQNLCNCVASYPQCN